MASKNLSVIIPAYNVAPYIRECIRSVLNQDGFEDNLDILVVIDGATDHTLEEATLAAEGHEHVVRVITQENAGLSAARNTGLSLVETEYVTFLDGDDIWLAGYLDTLLPLLSDKRQDLVEYDATRVDESGKPMYRWRIAAAQQDQVCEVSTEEFIARYRCYSWARVFRTDLVRGKPFPIGRRYEDSATTPWYYWNSCHRLSIGKPLIGYRVREQSILASPRIQDVHDIAATTSEAAQMYANTGAPYWQRMVNRSFQQAIGRIIFQPFTAWPELLRISRDSAAGVPPPPGFMRWLQVHATLVYAGLIYVKSHVERLFIALAPRRLIRLLFIER